MSTKDYGGWHVEKLRLNSLTTVPYCHEQEIWWVAVGCNIGYEEDGKGEGFARPVLIVKKFNYRFILGLPLSSTKRTGTCYHHFEAANQGHTALLSQIRAFDTRRLRGQLGYAADTDFEIIRGRLKTML